LAATPASIRSRTLARWQEDHVNSPHDAVTQGICLVPEDRKRHGIVPLQGVGANITMAVLENYAKFGVINAEAELASRSRNRSTACASRRRRPTCRSRVCLAATSRRPCLSKMLLPNPKVLILDEPTRGVDVGAKYEIYKLMFELVKQGLSIIMISSELPEVLGISDRVLVIGEGQLRGDFINDGLTQEQSLTAALGQAAELAA
jgi:D-xylose transport system ATP-binding protein